MIKFWINLDFGEIGNSKVKNDLIVGNTMKALHVKISKVII